MTETRFPIERISYSALSNFHHCPKYFELVNVKKVAPKIGTPQTSFGTLVHKYLQMVLNHEELVPEAIRRYNATWIRYCKMWKIEKKFQDLRPVGDKVIYYINGFLKSNYGNFKVLHIEYPIFHKVPNFPQNFKGFIDLVIELDNGKIIIIDIKTAASAFFFNKYKDAFKEYQLTLYKKFYSEIQNIDRDKIETCFMVIEKVVDSKKPIVLIDVTSGDKKIANAESWLLNSLQAINANKFIKNRLSCNKFGKDYPCQFYKSENCS